MARQRNEHSGCSAAGLVTAEIAEARGIMSGVTIRVLEGFEMGTVFENLAPPVTIGRERENVISLNDEQVSRFHAKIQQSDGNLIFTDLDSTNGTRVNGRPAKLRVLLPGDQIHIGRSLLVVDPPAASAAATQAGAADEDSGGFELARATHRADTGPAEAWPSGMPPLPTRLTTLQVAQLADVLGWIHDRLATALSTAEECDDEPPSMALVATEWRKLQETAFQVGLQIRRLTSPDEGAP